MNLISIFQQFKTEEDCLDFLENLRWPNGVTCMKCAGKRFSKYKAKGRTRATSKKTGEISVGPARYLYECLDQGCGHQFTVTTGTIFHDSHLPMQKWFLAIALMLNAKKGLSAKQTQRDLDIKSYRTAWYLAHRIRQGMIEDHSATRFTGTVEPSYT